MRRATLLLAGLALGAGGVLAPLAALPGHSAARAAGPLPPCRYDDIMTAPRGYDDWSVTLVDTILRVSKSYVPPDLVSTGRAGIDGGGKVRAVIIDDLRAMGEAAAAAGNAIGVQSAYRSYASQQQVFAGWVAKLGYQVALGQSARPGHSEHQLGLAIDFKSDPGGSPFVGNWGKTPAGRWMKAHAWEYGFVMSYPAGKRGVTCYDFEPWHFRYVGRDLAAAIHASGLTPREYLWASFTTVDVPKVTPPPSHLPRPSSSAPTAAPSVPSASAATSPAAATAGPDPTSPVASVAPSLAASPPAATSGTSPGASRPPLDAAPVASTDPLPIVGIGIGLVGTMALGWMVLRRGRSGVGL